MLSLSLSLFLSLSFSPPSHTHTEGDFQFSSSKKTLCKRYQSIDVNCLCLNISPRIGLIQLHAEPPPHAIGADAISGH